MKSIAILRHSKTEGPGYLATYLDARRIPWRLLKIDAGEPVPVDPEAWAGLVFMGGPMSVNDDLPWVGDELALVRRAVAADVPTLGHCLGGQLMAKALGGTVSRNPVKEIGWGTVTVRDASAVQRWFGEVREFLAFHWHGETFTIPPGGACIASSAHCRNQAFVLGPHLGMQCHVEMTPEMIRAWCESGKWEMERSACATVQPVSEIESHLQARVAVLNGVASRLYARWIEGLKQ